MIFVLKLLFTFVSDRKNQNHWSLFTHYSLLISHHSLLGIQTPRTRSCWGHVQGSSGCLYMYRGAVGVCIPSNE